jgi:hypothetical protein
MGLVDQLANMDADAMREYAASLIDKVARMDGDIARRDGDIVRLSGENWLKQFKIDQLTHEMAVPDARVQPVRRGLVRSHFNGGGRARRGMIEAA